MNLTVAAGHPLNISPAAATPKTNKKKVISNITKENNHIIKGESIKNTPFINCPSRSGPGAVLGGSRKRSWSFRFWNAKVIRPIIVKTMTPAIPIILKSIHLYTHIIIGKLRETAGRKPYERRKTNKRLSADVNGDLSIGSKNTGGGEEEPGTADINKPGRAVRRILYTPGNGPEQKPLKSGPFFIFFSIHKLIRKSQRAREAVQTCPCQDAGRGEGSVFHVSRTQPSSHGRPASPIISQESELSARVVTMEISTSSSSSVIRPRRSFFILQGAGFT